MDKIAGYNTDDHELIIMVGFDDCIIGVIEKGCHPPCVCYDREKVISKLATTMSREEAEEFHYFNQAAGFYGESTPCFLDFHDI